MTEQEWLECANPELLLVFLREGSKSWYQRLIWYQHFMLLFRPLYTEISKRKLRLWACACTRRVPDIEQEACCRDAIQLNEQFADGLVSHEELRIAEIAFPKESEGSVELPPQELMRPGPRALFSHDYRDLLCVATHLHFLKLPESTLRGSSGV